MTNNLLSPSQLADVQTAKQNGGSVTLTFPKPEIRDTGYNLYDSKRTQYSFDRSGKYVTSWNHTSDFEQSGITILGALFNSHEAAQRALDNGYKDRLRNEAEVTAAYHRHVDPLEWGEDGRCCVPTTEGMDEFRLLHTGYIFPFPNTDSGKAACQSFLAEVGADKLREIYYPKQP